MGFNIKNNYGPNVEVNDGGQVTLVQGNNGLWHTVDAEEVECEEVMEYEAKKEEKEEAALIEQLKPIFFNEEEEAEKFLNSIQGLRPLQITQKVNDLVSERKISDVSKHRRLWQVLHDAGLYNKSESNWNQQVK